MARKKPQGPLRQYPDGMLTLWAHHGPQSTAPGVAAEFAGSYWGYPRKIDSFDGVWHEHPVMFVGTFTLQGSDTKYWLIGDMNGWWRVARLPI